MLCKNIQIVFHFIAIVKIPFYLHKKYTSALIY